ncbi:MAG: hypothetical protein M9894_09945 [Planctomycetes bacterium]|nr:hypothetical protein [Planctomycetota bacterium]
MSDQNQILRLLATIREECAGIRSRQEELYEILISYKDQIHDLKQTVVEKLAGLPRSPYIAGQLVPAPHKVDGVDDYRELLATYLHKVTDSTPPADERPVDLVWEKPAAVRPEDIPLEEDEDDRPRRHHGGGGGGGRRDNDLERGPDRDIEPIDLDDDEDEEGDDEPSSGSGGGGRGRRKRRRRGGRGRKREGGAAASAAPEAGDAPAGDPAD